MKRRTVIVLGIIALFGAGFYMLTREPAPPYAFLKKFNIVDRRITDDGRRLVIVEGDYQDVSNAARREMSGPSKGTFVTTGVYSFNAMTTQYSSFSNPQGMVTVCTDISGRSCGIASTGFVTPEMGAPENKPGYCAVTYTRPFSLFDKFLVWVRGLFGGSNPTAPSAPPSSSGGIEIRV